MNIAINGFGRIGRAAAKIILEKGGGLNLVAANDLTDTAALAHLFKYDSCYGIYPGKVSATADSLTINGAKIKILAQKDPAKLPWKELKIDVVLECTGRFRGKEDAAIHLKNGARKAIISAPAKDVKTVVLGVNEEKIKPGDNIISNASCTTNCLAPVTQIVKDAFGIKKAIMSTIHSYTADQNLVDGPHKDLRRARAAGVNMVPTTTGAAVAVTETIPSLKDKFDGMAVRVPTPVGSLCDVCYVTKKPVTEKEVKDAFRAAAKSPRYKNILQATSEPLVLTDIVGNPKSAIVDLECTKVVDGDLLKVVAWYDNEWGYANRLVDLAVFVKRFL